MIIDKLDYAVNEHSYGGSANVKCRVLAYCWDWFNEPLTHWPAFPDSFLMHGGQSKQFEGEAWYTPEFDSGIDDELKFESMSRNDSVYYNTCKWKLRAELYRDEGNEDGIHTDFDKQINQSGC